MTIKKTIKKIIKAEPDVVDHQKQTTEDLYSPKDVARVRSGILKEQFGLDALTGKKLDAFDAVLDHKHDREQFVRGVLHREVNAFLGVVENAHRRHISYWSKQELSELLRQAADYLEVPADERYRHPGWLKQARILFNKLTAKQKDATLQVFQIKDCKNDTDRKAKFDSVLKTKKHTASFIFAVITASVSLTN
jgi:hypothetical protein